MARHGWLKASWTGSSKAVMCRVSILCHSTALQLFTDAILRTMIRPGCVCRITDWIFQRSTLLQSCRWLRPYHNGKNYNMLQAEINNSRQLHRQCEWTGLIGVGSNMKVGGSWRAREREPIKESGGCALAGSRGRAPGQRVRGRSENFHT